VGGWGEVGGLDLTRVAVLEHLLELGQVLGGQLDFDGVQRWTAIDGGVGDHQTAVGSPPGFPPLGTQPGECSFADPFGVGVGGLDGQAHHRDRMQVLQLAGDQGPGPVAAAG
jgi:hypothetical protein